MPKSTDDKRGNTHSAVPARIEQRAGEPTLKQSGRERALRISPGHIGRWSTRHPWRALAIWLGFVVACIALGAATGTSSLSDGSVGQSARGGDVMTRQGLPGPSREYAYVHSGTLVGTDPAFVAAVRDVQRRITALGLRAGALAAGR